MFILMGTKAREKEIGAGMFYCPKCRMRVRYRHLQVKRYFTLYLIPLFPIGTLGEYVQCSACQGKFQTSVLTLTQEQITEDLTPWRCPFCNNTNAPEQRVCLACQTPRIVKVVQQNDNAPKI